MLRPGNSTAHTHSPSLTLTLRDSAKVFASTHAIEPSGLRAATAFILSSYIELASRTAPFSIKPLKWLSP